MKILALSDQVVAGIYSPNIRERFGDVDIVVSCGDLPYAYLEYIVSLLNVPCFFVHGNHDGPVHTADGCVLTEPGGWVDLDGRTVEAVGVLLGGLEGCIRYRPSACFQYTEREMALKAGRLVLSMGLNRMRHGRHLDILVTHAPPFGIHDGKDWPHRGFKVFLDLMARFQPRYLLHGHKHIYGLEAWRTRYIETEVINVYPYRVIEW